MGDAKQRVREGSRADEPDWAAIKLDFETTLDNAGVIGRRHGVQFQTISARARREQWQRLTDRTAAIASVQDDVAGMAQSIRIALNSLYRRGNRLMARSEKEKGTVEAQLTLHERNVVGFGKLVRMTERFAALLDRCARSAVTMNATSQSLVDAYEEIESRLAEEAARLQEECHFEGPGTGDRGGAEDPLAVLVS